jgi:ABC-2 type transport system permease protein
MGAILQLVRKEFLQIVRDKATLAQMLIIPFAQLIILSNAATFTIRDTRLVVVDQDRSTTSRRLADRLVAGGQFHLVALAAAPAEAERALLTGRASIVVQVPPRFERDLLRTRHAEVQVAVNAEEGAVAGLVGGYAQAIIADLARELGATLPAPVRQVSAPEVAVTSRAWYNPARDYHHYMVPGVLVSLVTIIGTLVTAQNVARERDLGTLEQLNVTPLTRGQFLAGKLLPAWIAGMFLFTVGLALGKLLFDIPTRGPVPVVLLGAGVYLLIALGIGLLVSTVTRTQQQAMFVAFFILLIYLLMSGIFTPFESMPPWAQGVASLTPVRYFVWVMRAVLMRGATLAEVGPTIAGLGVAGVAVLTLAAWNHRKTAD